jgi:hypothetical protein
MELADFSGDALADDASVFVDQDAHRIDSPGLRCV